jgi:trans-2,3-dihydro-3-hydroxyanthranilate isomerase
VTASRPAEIEFALVDVFAEVPLTGNALAVVPDADALDVPTMRAVAREFNQSETTFLLAGEPGVTWRLRSFTAAGHEVTGAGHNAVGAWLWLAAAGRVGAGTHTQRIGGAVLPVEVAIAGDGPARVVMRQSAPRFGKLLQRRAELAAALGLAEDDLVPDRPAQVVSTGAGHLLVPVVDRAAVDRVAVDAGRLVAVLSEVDGEGCYVYTTAGGSGEAAAYARFFNPGMGLVEDPATGTAAGPLAVQLARHGDVDPSRPVLVDQGAATGRPSRLRIDVDGDRVHISGTGLVVATGRLLLPAREP